MSQRKVLDEIKIQRIDTRRDLFSLCVQCASALKLNELIAIKNSLLYQLTKLCWQGEGRGREGREWVCILVTVSLFVSPHIFAYQKMC